MRAGIFQATCKLGTYYSLYNSHVVVDLYPELAHELNGNRDSQ